MLRYQFLNIFLLYFMTEIIIIIIKCSQGFTNIVKRTSRGSSDISRFKNNNIIIHYFSYCYLYFQKNNNIKINYKHIIYCMFKTVSITSVIVLYVDVTMIILITLLYVDAIIIACYYMEQKRDKRRCGHIERETQRLQTIDSCFQWER